MFVKMHNQKLHQSEDGLTTLLFRLPRELREQIYELLLPQLDIPLVPGHGGWHNWHPKPPIWYELRWLATSRAIFLDAAPLYYTAKPIYLHLDTVTQDRCLSLHSSLTFHAMKAFPGNVEWIVNTICSGMITKLILEVYATPFSDDLQSLLHRFASNSTQFRHFTTLKELYISLRPKDDPVILKILIRTFPRTDRKEQETMMRQSERLRCMGRALRSIRNALPTQCRVTWNVPGVVYTKVTHRRSDQPEIVPNATEEKRIDIMESLWEFICSYPDEQLDELLPESHPSQTASRFGGVRTSD